MTYGQWTVKWWQWLLAIPSASNPALDETGKNTQKMQKDSRVSFLAGTFVNTIKLPRRNLTLSAIKPILVPAINYQANFIEDPIFKDEFELRSHVKTDINDIAHTSIIVDDSPIPTFRVSSDPILFPVQIANDIPHGVNGVDTGWITGKGGSTHATADGYWAFLKPLSKGKHTIHLAGSCSGGTRSTEAFYDLELI